MASEDVKLANCPFCEPGGHIFIASGRGGLADNFQAECMICGASGPYATSINRAIAAWNRRAAQPVASAALADNAELVERLKNARASDLHGNWLDGLDDAIAALQQESPRVAVKPLTWHKHPNGKDWFADCVIGRYEVGVVDIGVDAFLRRVEGNSYEDTRVAAGKTLRAAKACAQADYEQRILSALAHPLHQPAPEADYFGGLVQKARQAPIKASAKFPQPNYVTLKIAEEAGEVVRGAVHYAENRMEWAEVEGEIVQLLAMLIRLVTEGDQINGVTPPAHGVAPAPEPQAPVPDGVTDEMVEAAARAMADVIGKRHEQRDGSSWLNEERREEARAALTAANERSR